MFQNSLINSIGINAYGFCSKLQSLTFPKDINYIENFAFKQCTKLQKFYYFGTREPKIIGNPFSGCENLSEIYVTNLYLNDSFCGIKVKIIN